jgi:raw score 2.45
MPQWSVDFAALNMNGCKKGDYITLGQAMDDVRVYVMYYNFVRPHRYNQGLPPVLTKTTYRGLLN